MKKTLLITGLLFGSLFNANAQVLQSENFNSLTVGNVNTAFTGATAGQGGLFTSAANGAAPSTTTNAGNANFQVITAGNTSTQGLQIQGPNGTGGGMYIWKDGLPAAFASRTAGNNIIETEVDFFTGPTTTSTGFTGIYLYDSEFNVINGFIYTNNTRLLRGYARLNNAGTVDSYTVNLATGGLILAANTWYRLGFGYNTVTGQPTWRLNTSTGTSSIASSFWVTPTSAPFEVDIASEGATGNSVSYSGVFDNFVVKASATDTLLGVDQVNSLAQFSVYPNPAKDFITVENDSNSINAIQISDFNGRIVKTVNGTNETSLELNISDLSSGVYLLNVTTSEGSTVKKIVKQ